VRRHKADARTRVATRLGEMRSAAHKEGHRREEGQILVLFTMAIIVIMLFASIVIDLGVLRNNRQILVNAVDSAALAGGTKMPVNGCTVKNQVSTLNCPSVDTAEVAAAYLLVTQTLAGSYPGVGDSTTPGLWVQSGANYTATTANYVIKISFRCLIGVDSASPPQPYVSRDVPVACNPRMALGHTPVVADFKGAGPTRYSVCRPDLGDKCNVVVVDGQTTTGYTFGRVVGVNSGNSGAVSSAACNGPCGQPPAAPVDLVVIIDRTASMSATQIANARAAVKAVLGVYDPSLQRVALGFLGPSEQNSSCSGGNGGPAVKVNTFQGYNAVPPSSGTTAAWVQSNATAAAGATFLNIPKPTTLNNTDVLVAAISFSGGTTNNISTPVGWTPILRTNTPTAGNMSMRSYYKVISNAGGEPANYTFNFTLASNGNPATIRAAGGVIRYTGVNNAAVLDVSGGANGTDNSGTFSPTAPSVAQTTAEGALIGFFATNNNTAFTANSNGLAERFDRNTGGASPTIQAAVKIDSTAGATGSSDGSAGAAPAGAAGQWVAQHVVLNPNPYDTYGTTYPADLTKWIPIGFTGTDADAPSQAYNEVYSNAAGTTYDNTHIVSAINCFDYPGGTSTNLTVPMQMAAQYLQQYGRQNVKWGILFETDGEPNYGGYGNQATQYTCQSLVTAAAAAKAIANGNGQKIEVFTVGFFDPGSDPNCPDGTGSYPSTAYNNDNVSLALADAASTNFAPSPNGSANGCVAAENSDQDHFFCQPNDTELTTVFKTIATTFAGLRTHLVQLDPLPIVYNLSPTTGPGGALITITGKYFTGATTVKYAGASVAFTFLGDTTIRINAPAGAPGTADIIVTTPAGSSPIHAGAKFTRT